MPSGFDGYFLEDELLVPPSKRAAALAEARTLPKALLTDIDVNWLQVSRATPTWHLRETPCAHAKPHAQYHSLHGSFEPACAHTSTAVQ